MMAVTTHTLRVAAQGCNRADKSHCSLQATCTLLRSLEHCAEPAACCLAVWAAANRLRRPKTLPAKPAQTPRNVLSSQPGQGLTVWPGGTRRPWGPHVLATVGSVCGGAVDVIAVFSVIF